jgi:YidC/Oxa1 family membrane protein insertase
VVLSQPDRLGTLSLWFIEPPGIPVLTLLMGGTMLIQQAMTPMAGDPTQQKMMMFMPLIFTVMFVNFPAGLVLYWLVNNVLSIAQQYAYNKGLV